MFDSRKIKAILAALGLLAGSAAIPAAALAESADANPVTPVQAEEAAFDDQTIEAFAAAQVRVEEIRAAYMPDFQAAETDEQRQEINYQAAEEMVEAIENTPDLTIEEYNAILDTATEDPGLSERIDDGRIADLTRPVAVT